jgi:hypothetical protein
VVGVFAGAHPGGIEEIAVAGGGGERLLEPGEEAVRILGMLWGPVRVESARHLLEVVNAAGEGREDRRSVADRFGIPERIASLWLTLRGGSLVGEPFPGGGRRS